MKMRQVFSILLLSVFLFSACKSSEVASGNAGGENTTSGEAASDVVELSMADQLLGKHLEARGGLDNLNALQTMTWSGSVEMMGMNMPITIQFKRPNKMRQVVNVETMNAEVVSAFDGETAWIRNSMNGENAQQLPDEQARELEERATIEGPIVMYMEKEYPVSYDGEHTVKGRPAHKLTVQLPDNKETTIYLDAESFLEVKTESEGTNPMTGEQALTAIYPSDYREVGGVQMPYQLDVEFGGNPFQTLKLESIKVNEEISDSVFKMPGMIESVD